MKINCLSCGHRMDFDDDAYTDYEGQAKCYVCGSMLQLKIQDGKLKSLQVSPPHQASPAVKKGSKQVSQSDR